MAVVEESAPRRWSVRAKGPAAPRLLAEVADGFLILSGRLASANLPARWDLLRTNADLGGLVKIVAALDGNLYLRADIPLLTDNDIGRRLGQAGRALGDALSAVRNRREVSKAASAEPSPLDLPRLCAEAGWQGSSRRGDCCAVPLETHAGAYTALITGLDGEVQVRVELACWDSLSPTCRDALAAFLLTANDRLRLARATVDEDETTGAAQLEVRFEAPATASELRSALEALSVGAELCAPMADILQHDEAAKLFLSVRGGPQDREKIRQSTKRKI
jgi:hypothetical protein